MTKPKFTPDPPPYLQGMPIEKAFALFADWAIRQEYRKEDWWPKEFESRVQALEKLVPYCIGEWTIADAAYVNFGFEVVPGILPTYAFLYSDTGGDYRATESDYDSFGASAVTTGFGTFNDFVDSGEGLVMAWDGSGNYWTSSNGVNWTASSFPSITGLAGLVWFEDTNGGNPRWICNGLGAGNQGYYCYSSTDGITWSEEYATTSNAFRPNNLHSLATDGIRLIASGRDISGNNSMYVSDDGGENWSSYSIDNTRAARGCFYSNGTWFYSCVRAQLWSSPTANSGTWTLRSELGGLISEWTEIEYGNGLYVGRLSDKTNLYTSTDGEVWSIGLSVPSGTGGKALSYDQVYGWLFCYSTTVRKSSDGLTWSMTNLGSTPGFSARGLVVFAVV